MTAKPARGGASPSMTLLHAILRFLPLAGILSIFFIGVLARASLQRMRYGTWGIVRAGLKEPAQVARAAGFGLVFVLLGVQGFFRATRSVAVGTDTGLSPEAMLTLAIAGTLVMLGGLV